MASQSSLLIVEDERDILNLLNYHFQSQGYSTQAVQDGEQALKILRHSIPDLILLDIMLPGMSGMEVCQQIRSRKETKDIPIIMLTAKGEEADRISGLECGADDYVVKPFSPKELLLRVQAVLRRGSKSEGRDEVREKGGLRIEFDSFRVLIQGQEVELTATEFHLLSALVGSEGRVLSREHLLDVVWGYEFVGYARTVDTHMHRLRQKLGQYADWIQTVRGVGYRLTSFDLE